MLKEVKVDEFAVKLKISRDKQPEGALRDEMRRHLENLKRFTGDVIEIPDLVGNDSRVTFIHGVAGMGKSVLAKQLTVGWANRTMYKNYKLCIMFECRNLNDFQRKKGSAEPKKDELFDEFLKSKCNIDLGDGEGVLFVVDGLDELYDINTDNSVIRQLLNLDFSKFIRSKIIITGRPHVQEKLIQHGDRMGGLQTFEIQGLSDDQIDDYIDKFSTVQGNILAINKSKGLSKSNLPILTVPQFLNTFCCVAILRKGEAIRSSAELYSWVLYLLLKQHADDRPGLRNKTVPEIFHAYSKPLINLSQVCHKLLNENKIILEEKLESILGDTETGKNLFESFFIDVSDNFSHRYQFKHLTLMEFFASIHILKNTTSQMKVIQQNLEKGFIEVVYFCSSIVAGGSSEGIIKHLVSKVAGVQTVDQKDFLMNVVNELMESTLDKDTKFQRSLDIICLFLNKELNENTFMLSIINQLRVDRYNVKVKDSSNLLNICNHLVEVCKSKDSDIRMAFENVKIDKFEIRDMKTMHCLMYFNVAWIYLIKLKLNVNDLILNMRKVELWGKGKVIRLQECEVNDVEEVVINNIPSNGVFGELIIRNCKLNDNSFRNIGKLGVSCEVFWLCNQDIESVDCLEALVDIIEEKYGKGDLQLRELNIQNCTTNHMTDEMKMKVRRFTN